MHVLGQITEISVGALFVALFLFVTPKVASSAAEIEPALALKLAEASDTLLSVVIRPVGAIVPSELKAEVIRLFPTRAEQHREVISTLMHAAKTSQADVLDLLISPSTGIVAENVRSYWIDNIITANMSPDAIRAVAGRSDIESIRLFPDVSLVTPLGILDEAGKDQVVTRNHLKAINADSVWMAGYTGKGRLVGSLDTGVEGKHFALTGKWRGHNGAFIDAGWFNPLYDDTIPRTFVGSGGSHGTMVMGLMVAVLDALNDTLGACPDCQWISAAAIDIPCPGLPTAPCANIFDALQWIADPDGDPNTDWDAPDAVANPWGAVTRFPNGCSPTGIACSDVFWNAIDNIEAAGIMMIFAAGNEGACGGMSIRNPANRITSETNSFSVGMVDARVNITTPLVDPLSSRGPSDCDGLTIKPELAAPGVQLRTVTPGNGISSSAYGTSFATPLVAAGTALLREFNPNATVDQIKQALLDGAKDLGDPGPDNAYGHGLLDLMGALRSLPPNTYPAVYVLRDEYDPPAPGVTAEMVLTLRNCGTPATGVHVSITSSDPRIQVLDGHATFADMTIYGGTADNASDPFRIVVDQLSLPGERLPITVEINADDGYSRTIQGVVVVGPPKDTQLFTHDAADFKMSVGPTGTFGHSGSSILPRPGGIGYLYGNDPTQSIFEGALMIATGPSQVSDNARNESGASDVDFRVTSGGLIEVQEPGALLAEETRSAFDDSFAENPIGIFVEQRTLASRNPGHRDYLIVEYTIHNRSGNVLDELHAGLFFDWDFPPGNFEPVDDDGGFDPVSGVGWMRHRDENRFRGICVLSETPLSGYRYFANVVSIYDGFSEVEKWAAMTGGVAAAYPAQEGDGSHAIGSGPFELGFGESIRVAFGIVGGISEDQIIEGARMARLQYAAYRTPVAIDIMPLTCPNEVSLNSPGSVDFYGHAKAGPGTPEIAVAILGSAAGPHLNLQSARVGAAVPVRSTLVDIASPLSARESGECECTTNGSDGFDDHLLFFASEDISGQVVVPDADTRLRVDVLSYDNVAHYGYDCLRVSSSPFVNRPMATRVSMDRLGLASPNPFNAATVIEVSLEAGAVTRLDIYDLLGRRIRSLHSDWLTAGRHRIQWDGRTDSGDGVASGVYFATLSVDGHHETLKLVLLK